MCGDIWTRLRNEGYSGGMLSSDSGQRMALTFVPHLSPQKRILVIHDPKAFHSVMVKDQEFFPKRIHPAKYVLFAIGFTLFNDLP